MEKFSDARASETKGSNLELIFDLGNYICKLYKILP
jgi:hypothetical protein